MYCVLFFSVVDICNLQ